MNIQDRILIDKKILAQLLSNNVLFHQHQDKLHENLFQSDKFRAIYNELINQIKSGYTPDAFTIEVKLKEKYSDILTDLMALMDVAFEGQSDIEALIKMAEDENFLIQANQFALKIKAMALENETPELILNEISKFIHENASRNLADIVKIDEVLKKLMDSIEERAKGNEEPALLSGFEVFDEFTHGFHAGDLIIIAGESSQGKTSLALNITKNCCFKDKKKVLFISLEMSDVQLTGRILGSKSNVSGKNILYGKLSEEEIGRIMIGAGPIMEANIYITKSSSLSIDQIVSIIYNAKAKYDIDLVVIDYLQLIRGDKRFGREHEVGAIARQIKNTAMGASIPIIAISQFARNRENPKPSINRLRDSGQIQEAADMVILVWRPESYSMSTFIMNSGIETASAGKAHIDLAKGRNVGIMDFVVGWDSYTTSFFNIPQPSGTSYTSSQFPTKKPRQDETPF